MAWSVLPTWPFALFGIIEPAMLIVAYFTGIPNPVQFFADQAPAFPVTDASFPPQALTLTLQLLNVFLLLAAMAYICCWTQDAGTARGYLLAVAVADLGHVYASYRGLGADYFWDVASWNSMMWGNVGVSLFLHVNRLLTLVGAFGPVTSTTEVGGKKTQ